MSNIWILIANEHNAAIFASRNGTSQLLQSLHNDMADRGNVADRSNCLFACELVSVLSRGARLGDCDGVIILANAEMRDQLRLVMPISVSRLLIAEIAETVCPNPGVPSNDIDSAFEMPKWGMAR